MLFVVASSGGNGTFPRKILLLKIIYLFSQSCSQSVILSVINIGTFVSIESKIFF
jgi:hypothetical protein